MQARTMPPNGTATTTHLPHGHAVEEGNLLGHKHIAAVTMA